MIYLKRFIVGVVIFVPIFSLGYFLAAHFERVLNVLYLLGEIVFLVCGLVFVYFVGKEALDTI